MEGRPPAGCDKLPMDALEVQKETGHEEEYHHQTESEASQ